MSITIILTFIVALRSSDPRNKIYRHTALHLHAVFRLRKQKRQKNNVGKQRDRLIRRDAIHAD